VPRSSLGNPQSTTCSLTARTGNVKRAGGLTLSPGRPHPVRSASWTHHHVRVAPRVHPTMACELRCPACKANLPPPAAPEPDSEIECPKCGHVFPCEDNVVHAGAADEGEEPRKKKPRDEDGQAGKKPEEAKKDGKAPDEAPKQTKRKRRRAKK